MKITLVEGTLVYWLDDDEHGLLQRHAGRIIEYDEPTDCYAVHEGGDLSKRQGRIVLVTSDQVSLRPMQGALHD